MYDFVADGVADWPEKALVEIPGRYLPELPPQKNIPDNGVLTTFGNQCYEPL